MEKTISTNQASLILIIFTVALKFSVLPALTCDYAGNNGYIVALFGLIIDFLSTLVIILIIKKIPEMSFFDLLKNTLSKTVAIIIYTLLFFYFLIKLLIAMLELHDYYIVTLFENLNPLFFVTTLMLLLLYMFNTGFRTIGRMIEILFWPIAIGIVFTLLYPMGEVEIINLFPLFPDGAYPIFNGLFKTSFAYGDFMILFIMMGSIKYSKKATKKILLYFATMLNFIFNFYVIFVGTFGDTAVNQSLALSQLPLHNPYPTTIGRLEWLTIIMWTAILIFQVTLLGLSCSICLKEIFGLRDKNVPAIVTVGLLSAMYIPTYLQLQNILIIVTSIPFTSVTNTFEYVCIALLIISYIKYKKSTSHNFAPQTQRRNKYARNTKKSMSK